MKTIVNKIRFALLLGFIAIGMTAMAQAVTPNAEKLSISTQMFLDEMAGKISLDAPKPSLRSQGKKVRPDARPYERPIAKPDTIDGRVYISSILNVTDKSCISALESLGVIIECTFDNGIVTALIPVDAILDVAAIDQVKRVKVAEVMHSLNDNARRATNADDVLAFSNDARLAGLSHGYDGTGVILGVIDSGIDFQHIAFKDKNGNSRIKGLLCYTSTTATANPAYDWQGSGTVPAYDKNTSDHGTHTSSIAGGSSVIVSGTNVTVTDDHANATYGGMAPGADMYLAGLNTLYDSRIIYAMRQMYDYAEEQGKPLVVSNSWGSLAGPHDGTDDISLVVNDYFGDNHPNNVCLFAAGNNAGNARAEDGGGLYISATASSANPLRSILRTSYYSDCDGGDYYVGTLANAWCRTPNVTLGCRVYVLGNNTGAILSTVNVTPTAYPGTSVNVSTYYSGTLTAYRTTDANGKSNIVLTTNALETTSENVIDGIYHSDYTLAVEFYPANGSAVVDVWADSYSYFSNCLTTNGYNWVNGTDNMSVGVNAVNRNAISVGAYVSRTLSGYSSNDLGDISSYSSYATAGSGPLGDVHPTITAPGQFIISAYNHNYSSHSITPVVDNATNPYGYNGGTSMACPAAAGIVALWLQTAQELGKNLTTSEIKNIMIQTAIHDAYTNGANASHFGNGKIDALAGIEYILREYGQPMITASPTTVTFEGTPGGSYTETVTVGGMDLTGDITATLSDPSGCYSISATNLGSGGDLVITYSPTGQGTHNATITLTSPGVDPVTITINGTSVLVTDATVADGTTTNSYLPIYGNQYASKQINQMIYPASMLTEIQGKKIKSMTFYPTAALSFYGGSFNVSVGMTTQATYASSTYRRLTGLTTVATGQAAVRNATELVITFDEPFEYTGNNLVIEFEVTAVGTSSRSQNFYGVNPGSYTSFNSYGTTTNTYGRYTNANRRQFLPKVTFEWDAPFAAGEVSPTSLTFTDVAIGQGATQTVTVTSTGNMPFAPVIDTTNLPAEFTVTGNGTVAVGGTLDLTVTYTPTDAGPHSGSFTVTIGDQTYTVTVTGNGVTVTSTLTSNVVEVPVYKSDMQIHGDTYIFSESDVTTDTDMHLSYPAEGDAIQVLAKSDEPILRYELHHKIGAEGDWTYPNGNAVGIATHDGNSYVVNSETFTFPQDATEMWISMTDGQLNNASEVTYYVPVTVANGKVTTGEPNTYGAPIGERQLDPISIEVQVGGVKSSTVDHYGNHTGEWVGPNGINYCVYMPAVTVMCQQLNGATHVPYMYRAWLLANENIDYYNYDHDPKEGYYGTTVKTMPYLLAQMGIEDVGSDPTRVVLCEAGDIYEGQNTFGAPVDNPDIVIAVRVYYQRADKTRGHTLRAGGGYGFGQGSGRGDGIITGVNELLGGKQVVDVQYVNTLGMQSSEPFDGVNIVITRYSDGSTSTAKVVK